MKPPTAAYVIGQGDMDTTEQGNLLIETYWGIIESMPNDMFESASLKETMMRRMKGAQNGLLDS